jgi:hypothetical protein
MVTAATRIRQYEPDDRTQSLQRDVIARIQELIASIKEQREEQAKRDRETSQCRPWPRIARQRPEHFHQRGFSAPWPLARNVQIRRHRPPRREPRMQRPQRQDQRLIPWHRWKRNPRTDPRRQRFDHPLPARFFRHRRTLQFENHV